MQKSILFLLFILTATFSCTTNISQEKNATEKVENRGANKENWWDKLPRPEWKAFPQIQTNSNWFEIYQITPNIIAIYEPGQFEEVISYLITGTDKALLWDTGTGIGDIKQIVDQLTELPLIVLNSHTHYDHVGGNYQFDNIYGVVTDFTKKNAEGRPHEIAKEFITGDWIWKPTPAGFANETYELKPFQITKTIVHQDQIDLGGITLEILHTPGHAPDALCLLDRANRLLFTGDTFYPAPLYAHFDESDVDQYVESANYLAKLIVDVDHILPSHNIPWASSDYLKKMAIAFQQIKRGKAKYTETDGAKEYQFDGFSVITK